MPIIIKIGALPDYSSEAILEYVSPKAVENNGTNQFEIKAAIRADGTHTIRSGYSANAEIVLATVADVLIIPESTIEFDGDDTYVFVKSGDGTYDRRKIVTGLSDGLNIEVREGLAEGDVLRGNRIIGSE